MSKTTIPMARLEGLTISELSGLRDALHTISDVLSGLLCQPKFSDTNENRFNGAGTVLDGILSQISGAEESVINFLRSSQAGSETEAEDRAWALIGFEADMRDDLSDFAVLSVKSVGDVAKALKYGGIPKRQEADADGQA
jgi:hypothetical protein